MKKPYSDWKPEELIKEIKQLKKRKKFGLVWEDKKEDVAEMCKTQLPILKEAAGKEVSDDPKGLTNVIIEGDNYHSLSVLSYTHRKSVDVIYIDPPYNTGNRTWKYNNQFVDEDDAYRHSKWLSFMGKRLRLAKSLLTDKGIILVTIDDYELFNLGLLMNEIFGESNHLGTITIVNKADGRSDDKFIATAHEYMLVYAKNVGRATINEMPVDEEELFRTFPHEDDVSRYKLKPIMSGGVDSRRQDRPNLFYPVYVNEKSGTASTRKASRAIEVLPIDSKGIERRWGISKTRFQELIDRDEVVCKVAKSTKKPVVYRKVRLKETTKTKSYWNSPKYNAAAHGTKLLEAMLGKNRAFDYPKSLHAVIDSIAIASRPDSTVLDFFAGSGTTGHAVLELNKFDGGNRKFILCTNNEDNNNGGSGIAQDVCYPRIKRAMRGYQNGSRQVKGLGGNLKYFTTAFVDQVVTDGDKRSFVSHATEMLCLAENTFDKVVVKKNRYAIYKNAKQITAIVYDEDFLDDAKQELKKFKTPIVIYVFSYDSSYNEEDFADVFGLVKVKPIPAVILNVYARIVQESARKINV